MKVGINGFGRMGRLTMRALFNHSSVEIVHINDPAGDAATLAHLLNFDSIHGRWSHEATADGNAMLIGSQRINVWYGLGFLDIVHLPYVYKCIGIIADKRCMESSSFSIGMLKTSYTFSPLANGQNRSESSGLTTHDIGLLQLLLCFMSTKVLCK